MSYDFGIGEAHLYPAKPAESTQTAQGINGGRDMEGQGGRWRDRGRCIFHFLTGKYQTVAQTQVPVPFKPEISIQL